MTHASGILCGCSGLTQSQARRCINAAPGQSFDEFLSVTDSGATCTACMLDLEYFFVETARNEPRPAAATARTDRPNISLKRRIYSILDKIPWKVPINRTNWMPVFYGAGFEQYLWMTNHGLLFENYEPVVDFDVRFVVRDEFGAVRMRDSFCLKVGSTVRTNLSELMPASKELKVGNISLDRLARRPGLRGTTRPQCEIRGPDGVSSLHFQAPANNISKDVSFYYDPNTQKVGFTAVNATPDIAKFGLRYKFPGETGYLKMEELDVQPYGTRLHWIDLSDTAASSTKEGAVINAHYSYRGLGKLHLVIADADLNRLSIDHL